MGAGVQSTALALLARDKRLPKPDYAIFADTGWEPKAVYDHLDKLNKEILIPLDIELIMTQHGNIREESVDLDYPMNLPLFTRDPNSKPTTVGGMLKRQCTSNYKLQPIYSKVRQLMGAGSNFNPCKKCNETGRRVTPWSIKVGEPREGVCSVCRGKGVVERVLSPPKGQISYQKKRK